MLFDEYLYVQAVSGRCFFGDVGMELLRPSQIRTRMRKLRRQRSKRAKIEAAACRDGAESAEANQTEERTK